MILTFNLDIAVIGAVACVSVIAIIGAIGLALEILIAGVVLVIYRSSIEQHLPKSLIIDLRSQLQRTAISLYPDIDICTDFDKHLHYLCAGFPFR
jgi:hypothetical protein